MNKEQLKAKATELAEQLGSPVAVEGMTNSELESLIDSLQTAVDAQGDTKMVDDIEVSPEVESEPEPDAVVLPDFYIAEGKCITTRRGIKAEFVEVFEDDFELKGRPEAESKAIFDGWIEKGVIKKG